MRLRDLIDMSEIESGDFRSDVYPTMEKQLRTVLGKCFKGVVKAYRIEEVGGSVVTRNFNIAFQPFQFKGQSYPDENMNFYLRQCEFYGELFDATEISREEYVELFRGSVVELERQFLRF